MKILTLFIALTIFTTNASAGFLIEPYLGYEKGSLEYDNSGTKTEQDITATNFGARLGYQMLGFMGGLQAEFGKSSNEFTTPAKSDGDKFSTNAFGLFIGYELPIMFRAWASYFFTKDYKVSEVRTGSGAKGDKNKGNGMALGLGYTGLPFVSLNIEYRSFKIDEIQTSGQTTSLSGAAEIDGSSVMFSVSLPLNI